MNDEQAKNKAVDVAVESSAITPFGEIFQTLTGMSVREALEMPEDECFRRISENAEPRDVLKEAIEEMMHAESIHVYHIGEHGEVFAAHSEREVKEYYRDLSSYTQEEVEERFADCFTEITDLDTPFKYNSEDEGERMVTWRQLAEEGNLPTQLSTMYT